MHYRVIFVCVRTCVTIKQRHYTGELSRVNVKVDERVSNFTFMHQSIPPAPSSPPGYRGAFARLVSPWGGAFANFALPGGRAFANPRAIPELLTHTRFPIRI